MAKAPTSSKATTVSKPTPPRKRQTARKDTQRTGKNGKRSAASRNPWAPTKLGRVILEATPKYWQAVGARTRVVDVSGAPGYDADLVDAAEDLEDATRDVMQAAIDKVMARPITTLSHMTDYAIAYCAWELDKATTSLDFSGAPIDAMIDHILDQAGVKIQRPWMENCDTDEDEAEDASESDRESMPPAEPEPSEDRKQSEWQPDPRSIKDPRWPGHQIAGDIGRLTARLAAVMEAQDLVAEYTDDELRNLPVARAARRVDEGYFRHTQALKNLILELVPCLLPDVLTQQLIFIDMLDDFMGKVEAKAVEKDDIKNIERIATLVTHGLIEQCRDHPLVPHMWVESASVNWRADIEAVLSLKAPAREGASEKVA